MPLSTLRALNGSVCGGAIDPALCCDFLGLTGSRFLMPAARIGLHHCPDGKRASDKPRSGFAFNPDEMTAGWRRYGE